ncbi:LysR substrate-binding domain-containing protein [Nonomuraea wenchangensis]|uniref:DNA-binding transcriptional regulator, LysR family n=1 Tax=Nonomuraea wenchangensis TaxID=568860 RepID=A0A1I0L177_9ACTN|nr:LysR substrate-binding domain-containing protein [Nonomuraea wenchangensis]SEU32770.1 DNA-binding transcriptional regulator, LysR family [Nonomuraea wenchangensis]
MDLRNVDLNLLLAFDMLMTERSVTKAAQRLSIGQSAMSSTLARLRKLFNDPILVREGRTLVATPLAESLAQPVHDLMTGVESVLTRRDQFDPATAERTFTLIANDYLTMTFLQPLIARLSTEAPGVRLRIFPTGDDAPARLRKHEVDLLLMPREAIEERIDFPYQHLYRDRYVVAVDRDHPEVGETITIEQFSTLPYVAAASGHQRSLQEMQLDFLGVPRNIEITVGFGMAPFLLRGTRLITLVHETLAKRFEDAAGIRLLDPPIPRLQPITEIMGWTRRTDTDAGNRWLRRAIVNLAADFGSEATG